MSLPDRPLESTPLRELGLTIEGTPLEPIIAEFRRELDAAGFRKLQPHFYLTTYWVVHDDTIAIGIPFYLARPDLTALHADRDGHIEGRGRLELLRYLRHEMGHVVNYAYRLYDREDWVTLFGPMARPYEEEYRPEPFDHRFVMHLPGWYAQKHPDEDWAETFAVWLTPGSDWRAAYADWPVALQKLEYCDAVMARLRDADPLTTDIHLEWEVSNLSESLDDLYREWEWPAEEVRVPGLDGSLRAIFENAGRPEDATTDAERLPAEGLIRRHEADLMSDVFRWTGHFPERTRALLRHLATRAAALEQVYPADREPRAVMGLTALVTALAMNHVRHGSYSRPEPADGHADAAP